MALLSNFDILSLIFIDALENITDTSSMLPLLRSVNRTWFDVAGSTPQLWTKLILSRKSDFTNLEYAQFYLQKSGALPIDIYITLPDSVNATYEIGGITALLRDQSSRFRSFDIRVRSHIQLELFIISIGQERPAPLLEKLVMKIRQCPDIPVLKFLFLPTAFTPSPRLAHIELPGWPLPETFPHLPTLNSLTIDSMPFYWVSVHEIVAFLDFTSSLRHFVFKGSDDFSYNTTGASGYDPHIVYLPDLLTVDVTAPGAGADILNAMNAPELTDVRLDGFRAHNFEGRWEEHLTEPLSVTVHRLSARSPKLQRLILEYTVFNAPLQDYELIFSSAGFPQLEEVLLIGTDIDDQALLVASRRSSSLKRLTLRECEKVTGVGLLGFVRGWDSKISLTLQDCRNVTQQDIVALSEIVRVYIQ